jgi:hypothetical protein
MDIERWVFALSLAMLVGVIAFLELGYRFGRLVFKVSPYEGTGAIEAAVFAMLGLLLGFSFASGINHLDTRRRLIVEEANAIGTAYLRLDLLAAGDQPALRRSFRDYLGARLGAYEKLPDLRAAEMEIAKAGQLQRKIWSQAVTASGVDPTGTVKRLLLPAINQMIDVTTSRTVALHTRVPGFILTLLVVAALLSALLAGYAMAQRSRRSWLHMIAYGVVIATTMYAVIDLDSPHIGLIRLDSADTALYQLRDSMR